MALWRNTNYDEFVAASGPGASPEISIANDSSWATRILDVDWFDQIEAVQDFLGYARVISTGQQYPNPSGYISRTTPMPFPFYLEQFILGDTRQNPKYAMYCTKINRVQGIGINVAAELKNFQGPARVFSFTNDFNGMPLASYGKARMELGFESLPYDVLEDTDSAILGSQGFPDESLLTRYVTKTSGVSGDYVSINYGLMQYAEGANVFSIVPFSPGKILVTGDLHFRWELVPKEAVPSQLVDPTLLDGSPAIGGQAAIEFCLGRVNDSTFAGFDAGTLLLMSASITPIRGPLNRRLFSVEYTMKFKPQGHHKYFGPESKNPNTGGFIEISTDGFTHTINSMTPDGVHVFDVADFHWLFRPPNGKSFPAN